MQNRIEIDPRVCRGRPVIKGTRIPVAVILEQLAAGEEAQSVLTGYPELSLDDIRAALLYAAAAVANTEFEPSPLAA